MEGAGDTDKALGKPDRSRPMTRATPTASKGMCALHVCRSPVARALTRMLTCACCASLGRLCYTLKDYGVEFTYPKACLAVLVADQRSQASLATSAAGPPLVLGTPLIQIWVWLSQHIGHGCALWRGTRLGSVGRHVQ